MSPSAVVDHSSLFPPIRVMFFPRKCDINIMVMASGSEVSFR